MLSEHPGRVDGRRNCDPPRAEALDGAQLRQHLWAGGLTQGNCAPFPLPRNWRPPPPPPPPPQHVLDRLPVPPPAPRRPHPACVECLRNPVVGGDPAGSDAPDDR